LGKAPRIVTPHPGEFEALLAGIGLASDTMTLSEAMGKVCEAYGSILVLKSHVTWIRSPDGRSAVWDGMCPELGTAGSGDALAGLVAGLAARKLALLRRENPAVKPGEGGMAAIMRDSAMAAVIAHGRAGKNLARTIGWFEASEIAAEASRILSAAGTRRINDEVMEKTWRSGRLPA
jgi:NAD(P)H-hydrate repair Nnr-like enzyme with NAD(P)H-hydrate dehydratase domain